MSDYIVVHTKGPKSENYIRVLLSVDWIIDFTETDRKTCLVNYEGHHFETRESFEQIIELITMKGKIGRQKIVAKQIKVIED